MFPDGEKEGVYHTADATLWFFHALDRYLEITDDRTTLKLLLPTLLDIVEHHFRGTNFKSTSIRRTDCCVQGRRVINSPGWTRRWTIGS